MDTFKDAGKKLMMVGLGVGVAVGVSLAAVYFINYGIGAYTSYLEQ